MSYEVQLYKNRNWVISSVQDDKDESIYEAQRLVQGTRTSDVRVVQEIFDEASGTYRMKVIFRRSRPGSLWGSSSEGEGKGAGASSGERKIKERVTEEENPLMDRMVTAVNKGVTAFLSSVAFLILKFAVIIGLGVWLLETMNGLVQKL